MQAAESGDKMTVTDNYDFKSALISVYFLKSEGIFMGQKGGKDGMNFDGSPVYHIVSNGKQYCIYIIIPSQDGRIRHKRACLTLPEN